MRTSNRNIMVNCFNGYLYSGCFVYTLLFLILSFVIGFSQDTHKTCIMHLTENKLNDKYNDQNNLVFISKGHHNEYKINNLRTPKYENHKDEILELCLLCNVSYVEDTIKCDEYDSCEDLEYFYPNCEKGYFRRP